MVTPWVKEEKGKIWVLLPARNINSWNTSLLRVLVLWLRAPGTLGSLGKEGN